MKRSAIPALVLTMALFAGCAQDQSTTMEPIEAAYNKGGGGGTTTIPLKVEWSNSNHLRILGDTEGATTSYVRGECGVGAHTWTGVDQAGWFDVQPTIYKESDPACLRHLKLDGRLSDVEVRVFNMTSVTTTGQRRVGMGIQTDAVKSALGCDRLIYDKATYSGSTSATVTRLPDVNGARSWQIAATTAACEVVNPRNGKVSLNGTRDFPFSFTMTEIKN